MKQLIKNRKFQVLMAISLVVAITALAFGIISYSGRNDGLVARVDSVGIPTTVFDAQVAQQQSFFKQANQTADETEVRQTALNTVVDNQLIENYATNNGIAISQEQIDAYYSQRVSAYKNEQELLDTLNRLYGTNKEQYLQTIRNDLLREAVQANAKQPLADWLKTQRESADIKIYITI